VATIKRSFLFLQGVCSPFFAGLADRLHAEGHRISKVNFNCGDVAYWRNRPACAFRGRLPELAPFLKEKYRAEGITDIVLFGDRRPVHRPAIETARELGVRVHVFEEGYFRPYWITLERDGVNLHSRLPRDPEWYLAAGRELPAADAAVLFRSPFRRRALHDVLYHGAGSLNAVLFPGYRTHAPVIAPVEYAAYVRRFALLPLHERKDGRALETLISGNAPYFLFPLQLSGDAQIRDHSEFDDMAAAIARVVESFARHAPPESRLVIKNHPLDAGLVSYPGIVRRLEKRFGIPGRTLYVETGDLSRLLRHAKGVVTVNSTAGGSALESGCPTVAMGDPLYNLPGLTFQGPLERFWKESAPPDPMLFRRFKKCVVYATQVNGGFYCSAGIRLAVANSVGRLVSERCALEELQCRYGTGRRRS
jgi:capsular polysaccharide export protein